MPLFRGRQPISEREAVALAEAAARRRGWSWLRPEAKRTKKGWHVRLRPDEMESPYVEIHGARVVRVGFEDRYLADEGDWYED